MLKDGFASCIYQISCRYYDWSIFIVIVWLRIVLTVLGIALSFIMGFLALFRWKGERITKLALNFSIKLSSLLHLSFI